jgi:hypothetical protein
MAETIVWVDPDGVSTTLHGGSGMFAAWNVSGRFSPPTRFEEEGIPEGDGSRLRAVHHGPNDIVLPVWVQAATDAALRTSVRALVSSMNPKRGDGILRITSPLGDQREVVCRVVTGLEGAERIGDTTGDAAQLLPLVFRAHDPYWQDTSDTVSGPWTVGSSPGSFFPLFPLRLASSEVFAQVTVVNTGDEDAWPVWTVTGPGANPKLKNLTTGKTLDLASYTIAAGEVVTIDTRPTGANRKTVQSSTTGNLYSKLTAVSALWSFVRGSNSVSIEMGSATSASSVQVARRHRYLAA